MEDMEPVKSDETVRAVNGVLICPCPARPRCHCSAWHRCLLPVSQRWQEICCCRKAPHNTQTPGPVASRGGAPWERGSEARDEAQRHSAAALVKAGAVVGAPVVRQQVAGGQEPGLCPVAVKTSVNLRAGGVRAATVERGRGRGRGLGGSPGNWRAGAGFGGGQQGAVAGGVEPQHALAVNKAPSLVCRGRGRQAGSGRRCSLCMRMQHIQVVRATRSAAHSPAHEPSPRRQPCPARSTHQRGHRRGGSGGWPCPSGRPPAPAGPAGRSGRPAPPPAVGMGVWGVSVCGACVARGRRLSTEGSRCSPACGSRKPARLMGQGTLAPSRQGRPGAGYRMQSKPPFPPAWSCPPFDRRSLAPSPAHMRRQVVVEVVHR